MEVSDVGVTVKKKYNFSIENILTKGTEINTKNTEHGIRITHVVKEDMQSCKSCDSTSFEDNNLVDTRCFDKKYGCEDTVINSSDVDIDLSDVDSCEDYAETDIVYPGLISESDYGDGGGIKKENLDMQCTKEDRKTHSHVQLNVPTAHKKGNVIANIEFPKL